MKRFKRSIAIFLCVVMTLTAAPLSGFVGLELPSLFNFEAEAASYSGKCGDNLYWSLDTETGVLNITGTGAMESYKYSSEAKWYDYKDNISSINIGNKVTSIGDWAFAHFYSLKNIDIPDSVTIIGNQAFYNCARLTNVSIGNSVATIGDAALDCCYLLKSFNVDSGNKHY